MLLAEAMAELMKTVDTDLDKYCETVIFDEFQM
jgi:hypothetical protein